MKTQTVNDLITKRGLDWFLQRYGYVPGRVSGIYIDTEEGIAYRKRLIQERKALKYERRRVFKELKKQLGSES